ncbi:cuticle protein 64-like [Dermacentor silvarum]|uniref:cuticle protein 64-like n=1 Tax=Dermacentor silvarum TaxID=543639 RepID=UPI001897D4D0|nr:cuticle protein 64-like [Dermacentor silvarum]
MVGTAFAGHVPSHSVPVAAVATTYHHSVVAAPTYVAAAVPAVSTTVHHAPAVSKATRVTSYQTTQPGVPHTVAKVSTYIPAATAVHTVHASVPTAVTGVLQHAPAYAYGYYPARYSYSHRYNYHPLPYGYVHGLSPYGLNYGYGLGAFGYATPVKKCESTTFCSFP